MKHSFLFSLALIAVLLPVNHIFADNRLPHQPIGTDGNYIVKWDCDANDFASSNDMEYDETVVIAINLAGTSLGEWLQAPVSPARATMQRIPALNLFHGQRDDGAREYDDTSARLWLLRDTIYGAAYNLSQLGFKNGGAANKYPATPGSQTQIFARIFGLEMGSGTACGDGPSGATGWWLWNNGSTTGWNGPWAEGSYTAAVDNKPFFVFAPYTGTRTATETLTVEGTTTDRRDRYWDRDHYTSTNGYGYPCTPLDYPQAFAVSANPTTICTATNETAIITLAASEAGMKYVLYLNGTEVSGTEQTGNGNALTWTVGQIGTYQVYALPVQGVSRGLFMGSCSATNTSGIDEVIISSSIVCNCPDFVWATDGQTGFGVSFYPGGWYEISCTCDAGAPTIAVSGNGITVGTPTQTGNTTTVRVTFLGTAIEGDQVVFTATAPANSNYIDGCTDERTVTIASCNGGTAKTYKIEWFNYITEDQSFPEFWYHDGDPVFLRDNNGKMEADIAHTDGQDEWYLHPVQGMTIQGQQVYYIQNALTQRYLCRGSQHGNVGSDWEYAEALLTANNMQTADYQWLFWDYTNSAGKTKTAIVCVDGFTGTNFSNGAYMLHTRMWEAEGLFSNPQIRIPGMACGKMAGQTGSPVFYLRNMDHPANPAFGLFASLEWDSPAPAEQIDVNTANVTYTFTASRSDNLHSINQQIWYEAHGDGVTSVDRTTGKVTVLDNDVYGCDTIMAIIEEVGCFGGDTLFYTICKHDVDELIFDNNAGNGLWSDKNNWAPLYSRIPSCSTNIRIHRPCSVDLPSAQAANCVIEGQGSLNIKPTAGLTVSDTLFGAMANTVFIEASAQGNGALVLGMDNKDIQATVQYYSLAYDANDDEPTWQYIGTPLADAVSANSTYPNALLYAWTNEANAKLGGNWQAVDADNNLSPFTGYCISQDQQTTYTLSGTICSPEHRTIPITYHGNGSYPGFSLVANSWTAPIRVRDMQAADFGLADATVYIFNSGTYYEWQAQNQSVSTTGTATARGQYNALPIHAVQYMTGALQTIPSMQGFFVYTQAGKGSSTNLTLDYSRIVLDRDNCTTSSTPMRVQRKAQENDDICALQITVMNAVAADHLWLLASGRFCDDFDNGWDARKVEGTAGITISASSADGDMSVAAVPQMEGTIISFAAHKGLPYQMIFSITHAGDAALSELSSLLLYDALTQTYTPITDGAVYHFNASADDHSRFRLVRQQQSGQDNEYPETDKPRKFLQDGHLFIRHGGTIYDAAGHKQQ